ncbi:DoxX family membrane protein [Hymenobacter sp. BT770]|uniref:DoxX family membrane protein n=1 Tax=Hymenobacter sp. BT770 TaxID=2886942 RepID=UPI001D103129|nr:DoxX family membrane protein [Hymenobacter sp. BT770]MCC3151673.1 DoxX family membrane protein [Hymenobacter sp. BT770]MDO3413749.1 DoxX family membrane protein [Hymenobacter sp. BT770]
MNIAPALFYALCILLPVVATGVGLVAGGPWRRVYVLGSRLLLGALMLGGGLYKLSDNHIPGLMGPPMNHAFLAKYSLEIFAQFIGVAQLLIGLLLLSGRFALLGAVLLVPMWLNIIFLTWSQHWVGTPFLTTGFLVLNLGLLLHDYPRLKWLLYPPADAPALRAQRLQTAPRPVELLWWLGAGVVVIGSLLYPVSLRTMTSTMLLGATLLLGATAWHYFLKRQQRVRQ